MISREEHVYKLLSETLQVNKIKLEFGDFDCFNAIAQRNSGKIFSKEEHLHAIVFALLSSQRPWKPILLNKHKIEEIFHDFNFQYIIEKEGDFFAEQICKIKCGNKSIHRQMMALNNIIAKLQLIINEYGTLDEFIISDTPINIAKTISSNKKYKIPELGFSLALEYLRNVGIDICKPDTQLCRLFGKDRLGFSGYSIAKPAEVVSFIANIADMNNLSQAKVGTTFWMLCAKDYANICSQKPKCNLCRMGPVCMKYDNLYIM